MYKQNALKVTKHLQTKLEDIFKSLKYAIRYERGTFKSGHCIIEERNVIVINKFYPLESKVNALVEILRAINPDLSSLQPAQANLVRKLKQTELKF